MAIATQKDELEQFAYIVSHDLQEQVRNISNFTGLIARHQGSIADEDFKYYLSVVNESSARLTAQLAALLTFSRIARDLQRMQVDTRQIVEAVLRDLGELIQETRAEITVGELPVITGDPATIRLIFEGLISNALKFRSKHHHPQITIGCQNKSPLWEFSISDNGIGIKQNHFQKIFLIFQQLHTADEYPGTGAGLAFAKKAVEANQGEIWLNSEYGEGAVFYFTIPMITLT